MHIQQARQGRHIWARQQRRGHEDPGSGTEADGRGIFHWEETFLERTGRKLTLEELDADMAARQRRRAAWPGLLRMTADALLRARQAGRAGPPWTRLVWAWQRARRGWSDRDLWSLDAYLCGVIAGSLTDLRDSGHGGPGDLTPTEWRALLARIAEPLAAYSKWRSRVDARPEDEAAVRAPAQEAIRLLADRVGDLWD